jgi:hypothetical protein
MQTFAFPKCTCDTKQIKALVHRHTVAVTPTNRLTALAIQ